MTRACRHFGCAASTRVYDLRLYIEVSIPEGPLSTNARSRHVVLVLGLLAPAAAHAQSPNDSAIGFHVVTMQIGYGIAPMEHDPSSREVVGAAAVGKMKYQGGVVQHTQKVFNYFW